MPTTKKTTSTGTAVNDVSKMTRDTGTSMDKSSAGQSRADRASKGSGSNKATDARTSKNV